MIRTIVGRLLGLVAAGHWHSHRASWCLISPICRVEVKCRFDPDSISVLNRTTRCLSLLPWQPGVPVLGAQASGCLFQRPRHTVDCRAMEPPEPARPEPLPDGGAPGTVSGGGDIWWHTAAGAAWSPGPGNQALRLLCEPGLGADLNPSHSLQPSFPQELGHLWPIGRLVMCGLASSSRMSIFSPLQRGQEDGAESKHLAVPGSRMVPLTF